MLEVVAAHAHASKPFNLWFCTMIHIRHSTLHTALYLDTQHVKCIYTFKLIVNRCHAFYCKMMRYVMCHILGRFNTEKQDQFIFWLYCCGSVLYSFDATHFEGVFLWLNLRNVSNECHFHFTWQQMQHPLPMLYSIALVLCVYI